MSLFVGGLGHSSSNDGRAGMLIGNIDILTSMGYVQQVEVENLKDRDELRNKKERTMS